MKIGDRVKISSSYYLLDEGSIGVVRHITEYVIGVEFKGWGKGHLLGKRLTKDDGWYFIPTALTPLKKKRKVAKKRKARRGR